MAYNLENRLVIGISSRALFDLTEENEIFETQGVEAYCKYQVEHENDLLMPGNGFMLVKALLNINKLPGHEGRVEVIVMSHNSPDTSLRVFNSIEHYGLDITRAVLASGAPLTPYLEAFQTDLYLSADEDDVQAAIDCGIAAGIVCCDTISTPQINPNDDIKQIRIAFDGDAVLFSDDSETIFKEKGLEAFEENERRLAKDPMKAGPFAKFLKTISDLQRELDETPIRTALVTARSAPSHERVIRTLRAWNVRIDEAFFLGGVTKKDVLKAFGAHIFFDDQAVHTEPASKVVPSARVPYKKRDP
ncbi:MAG: 5'-nucleotidase [Lachnospiraceae bacterium]|nr:5'-nucleotidase [Lachnospiraceae bacterium]